jgi:transposase
MRDRTGRPSRQAANPAEERYGFVSGNVEPRTVGAGVLIQITPQLRILVAIDAIDGRKGIDSLAQLCREKLDADPFSGCLFIFRSRRGTAIKLLAYDGQGFWLATKRLSKGRFRWWPTGSEPARTLRAHQAQLLLAAANPETEAPPVWRQVSA